MKTKKSTDEKGISNLLLRNILREREELKEKRSKCEDRLRKRYFKNFRNKLVDLYADVRPLVFDRTKENKEFLKQLNKLQRSEEPVDGYNKAPLVAKFRVLVNLMIRLDDVLYEIGVLDPLKEEIGGDLIDR